MVEKDPEKVMEVNIELAHGKFRMEDAFELRVKAIEIGKASEELWNNISDDHKAVLTQIFKRALEVMHENTDRFLPNIITGAPGDMVNITCQVLLSKIEEQVEIITQTNEFEREAAKQQMIAELISEVAPLTDEEFLGHVEESLQYGIALPNSAVKRLVDMIALDGTQDGQEDEHE